MTVTETITRPYFHTMDCQTMEQVEFLERRDSPGTPLPINVPPTPIPDDCPSDHEIRDAVRSLSNR
jgi:hypothetical protein